MEALIERILGILKDEKELIIYIDFNCFALNMILYGKYFDCVEHNSVEILNQLIKTNYKHRLILYNQLYSFYTPKEHQVFYTYHLKKI